MSQYTIHYKSNNNVVYSCKYHAVWCPKHRRSVLVNGVEDRLKEIIQSVCTESRAEVLQLDRSLARWAYRKYKKLRGHLRRATHWLARISRRDPGLFAHWQMGVRRGSTAGAV